jgi:hypothetical protein
MLRRLRQARSIIVLALVALLAIGTVGLAHAYAHAEQPGAADCATCRGVHATPVALSVVPELAAPFAGPASDVATPPAKPRRTHLARPATRGPPSDLR